MGDSNAWRKAVGHRSSTAIVVDNDDVVRERLPTDWMQAGYLVFDLEGELFFGAAPDLQRIFHDIERHAVTEGVHHVLLRLKRVRNPDMVSLGQFEHFLKTAEAHGISLWLAGVQPDLLQAFSRMNIRPWLPDKRLFPEGKDENSATLAAIRGIRTILRSTSHVAADRFYYLM